MNKAQYVGMVIGSFLFHFIVMGMSLSFGILYSEIHTEFNVVQSKAAWVASLFTGLIGLAGVPVSYFVTIFGERWVALVGSLVLTCGMLTSSFVESFNWLYLTYGIIGGSGASISLLPATTIIMKVFKRNRPLVLAMCSSGSAVGGLALPPFLSYMISEYGWRGTYILLAGLALQTLPGSLMFVGDETSSTGKDVNSNEAGGQTFKAKSLAIARNTNFMCFAFSAVVGYIVIFTPGTFLPDLMKEAFLNDQQIYIVLMAQGAGHLLGRLAPGIFDRVLDWDLLNVYTVTLFIGTITSILYFFLDMFIVFIILAISIGIVSGGFLSCHVSLVAQFLDKDHTDIGFGWICTLEGIAVVAGMPLAGLIIDSTSTLRSGFVFSAGVLFLSMVLALVTKLSVLRGRATKSTKL